MTINRTIGSVGADHLEFGAAMTWLVAQGGWSDHYTFTFIDETDVTTEEGSDIGPLNGFTLTIRGNTPHNGNPNSGIKVNTTLGRIFIRFDSNSSTGTIIVEDIVIVNTIHPPSPGATQFLIDIRQGIDPGATDFHTIIIRNIVAYNEESDIARMTFLGAQRVTSSYVFTYRILDCKVYRFNRFKVNGSANHKTTWYIENCISDLMYEAVDIGYNSGTMTEIIFMKSFVSMRTASEPDWAFRSDISNLTIDNCADEDNSLTFGSNNQHNINPNNEFQSVDITQSNYLKLTPGTVQNNVYTAGAQQLGQNGIRPQYAGNTDIEGNTRPDAAGFYSIGPTVQLYIEITIPEIFTNDHFSDILKARIDLIKTKKIESGKIIITDRNNVIVSDDNQFISYNFDSEYGQVSSVFSCTLVDNGADIKTGYGIQLIIRNKVLFRGIIQRRNHVISKDTNQIILSGKDRSSILVEGHCNSFKDFNNRYPFSIVDELIAQSNFYVKVKGSVDESADSTGFNSTSDISDHNSAILSDVNNSDTINERNDITTYDGDFDGLSVVSHYKISIGDLVFEKINQLVKSQGYEILYQPDGTLYIGNLEKKRRYDDIIYEINNKKTGENNNVLSSSFVEDISGRYSTVSISSQAEGYRYSSNFPSVNEEKIATDSTLEGKKYYAELINDNQGSAEKYAIRKREDQRIEGYQVIYEVAGHLADNGEMWDINRFVNVFDDMNNIHRHLVLYGRTFSFDASTGTRTILRLSLERINELVI